ncbi:MAG: xanthine dehydrogenase small subunit [Bacteroidales bacterium]|nr:xanthine dehydrogenase small subunit [Bacteroidales bacterium]
MKKKSHVIRFVLGDQPVTLDFAREGILPSTTVLNYLRLVKGRTGTKEGCAEGDCGACTVVLGQYSNGSIDYRAVNSCLLFLPALHGKQLITVEDIADTDNHRVNLHPLQQSLVDHYGSQCGFCTPGILMSLFALYRQPGIPTRYEIQEALAGNLCRCTGYQPIQEAAEAAFSNKQTDRFDRFQGKIITFLKEFNETPEDLMIENNGQRYLRPAGLKQALEWRREFPAAVVVNGSTDIALRQSKKHEMIPEILDMGAICELKHFEHAEGYLRIGSGLLLEEVRRETEKIFPALHSMLGLFASRQIRQVATLGGNLGTASPIGDMLPFLITCEAALTLSGAGGERTLDAEEFITGYRNTALGQDELIRSVTLPLPKPDDHFRFYKVSKRKDVDIATVSGAFRLRLDKGTVTWVILTFGGMAEMPRRAFDTEKFLKGKPWTREHILHAMTIIRHEFHPISDARSGAEFRKLAAANLLMKFHHETVTGHVET